jgi:integral membrane protein (TIGR01906 family)
MALTRVTDGEPRGAARVEVALAALVIAVMTLGAALLPITTPQCVGALVRAVGSADLTGLGEAETLQAAESVRFFVVDPDAPPLPEEIDGVTAFDAAAVSHLIDVREVLVPARRLTLGLLVLVAAWALLRLRSAGGRRIVGAATRTGAWILVAGAGLGVLVGLTDFDALFTWFHGLFFEPGTWVFPDSALLIRVFPLPFWTAAGALWGVSVLMFAALLAAASRRLCFTRGSDGV